MHPLPKILLSACFCFSLGLATAAASTPAPLPWNDLYYQRQGQHLLIGTDEAQTECFYGLKIGDKKADVLKKLTPAFTLLYELKAIGPAYLLSDRVYPDYYLTVQFDQDGRVMLISYQKNEVYHLD